MPSPPLYLKIASPGASRGPAGPARPCLLRPGPRSRSTHAGTAAAAAVPYRARSLGLPLPLPKPRGLLLKTQGRSRGHQTALPLPPPSPGSPQRGRGLPSARPRSPQRGPRPCRGVAGSPEGRSSLPTASEHPLKAPAAPKAPARPRPHLSRPPPPLLVLPGPPRLLPHAAILETLGWQMSPPKGRGPAALPDGKCSPRGGGRNHSASAGVNG